jgi:hypothetical protein
MKLIKPTAEEGAAGLRAMATVAQARQPIAEPTRRLIEAGQRVLLGKAEDIDSLDSISPSDLAQTIQRPEIREQLISGMVLAGLSAGEPPVGQADVIQSFAQALDVQGPQLKAIERLAHHDLLFFKLCVLRNGHIPDMIKEIYRESGARGVIKSIAGLRGHHEDPTIAARFQAWEKLPAGTLGATVFHHYRANGFALPGERGGFPEQGVYHDISHVLAGYDTSPQGETLVGGFIAGYRENRPDRGLFTALFVLSIFSAGVDVTPIDVGAKKGTIGDVAERFLLAIERGSKLSQDLSDDWNFWDYIELPLEEAREQLGVPPKTLFGSGDTDR